MTRLRLPSCPAGKSPSPCKSLSRHSEKHKSLCGFPKSALWSARSVPHEGAYRDRHGRWQRNAVDAACRSVCQHARTNGLSRTVKSYGSDTPTLVSSATCASALSLTRRSFASRGHGGQQARRTRKSTKELLKPSRREGRDVSAEPVVPAACIFFCRRAMGAASSRPSLRL